MEHVDEDGVLDPMDVLEGGVLKVEYAPTDPSDSITVFWAISPSVSPLEFSPQSPGTHDAVETPIAVTTIARSLNKRVEASYVVRRGSTALISEPLKLRVLDLPDSALSAPEVTEATGALLDELDLTTFDGDAHVTATWPLIAEWQRVWMFVHGRQANGEDLTLLLLDGHEVTRTQVENGLDIALSRAALESLRNRSPLRIEMHVAFDGSGALLSARAFPLRELTLILNSSVGELEGFENAPIGEIARELVADLLTVEKLTGTLFIRAAYPTAIPYTLGKNLRGTGSVKITLHNPASSLQFGVIRYQYQPSQVIYFDEFDVEITRETTPPFGSNQGAWVTYTAPDGRKVKSMHIVTLTGPGFGVDEFTLID
jgi:hypothetical protein